MHQETGKRFFSNATLGESPDVTKRQGARVVKEMFQHGDLKITWLGHDGFKLEQGSETLVIDPFKLVTM